MINLRQIKGLNSLAEEYRFKKLILVCTEPYPRKVQNVIILPWKLFLEQLWAGDII